MELLIAGIAILVQAAFTGSETSLVRANWIRVSTWAGENRAWAKTARALLARREFAVISTLVGNNLCIVIASGLAERFVVHELGPSYTILSILVVTLVSLFLGDFLPKSIAQAFPETWLCALAPVLRVAERVLLPLNWTLARMSGVRPQQSAGFSLSRSDFLFALRGRNRLGEANSRLHGIVGRLLDFPQVKIGDVMTPLDRVVAVPETVSYESLVALIRTHRFSRYPLYRGERENIVGVVHVRDLLQMPERVVRKPVFVAMDARALEVMNLMKDQGEHLAFICDAEHRTVGIVSLEDLLEELVGEIRSEE